MGCMRNLVFALCLMALTSLAIFTGYYLGPTHSEYTQLKEENHRMTVGQKDEHLSRLRADVVLLDALVKDDIGLIRSMINEEIDSILLMECAGPNNPQTIMSVPSNPWALSLQAIAYQRESQPYTNPNNSQARVIDEILKHAKNGLHFEE
jgi:hypothetical protein